MINLLSETYKKNLRAARVNVILRRYVNFTIFIAILTVLIFGAGYFITIQERNHAEASITDGKAQVAKYNNVRTEAKQFETNLKSAKVILSGQITFSKLVVAIAKALPNGAVLNALNIETADIGGKPITLTAQTVDAGVTPLKLKSALEQSSLFENVSIISIKRSISDGNEKVKTSQSNYPVSVNLSVSLTKQAGRLGDAR